MKPQVKTTMALHSDKSDYKQIAQMHADIISCLFPNIISSKQIFL